MVLVGLGQYVRPPRPLLFGEPMMHVVRREEPEPDVVMLGVVPGEEVPAKAARVLDRSEALWEIEPVLQGLELRLGERIVVRPI